MAIDTKLQTIENGCSDVRAAIKEKDSTLGTGSITTLGNDIRNINNRKYIRLIVKEPITETTTDPDSGEEIENVIGYNYNVVDDRITTTQIAQSAYKDRTDVVAVILPDDVTKINRYTFQNCNNLNYINLQNIENLGGYSFSGCDLYCDIDMPNLKSFSNNEGNFKNNKHITHVKNLGSVTAFYGDPANRHGQFYGCSSLESVVLPETVTNLGNCAFCDCSNLKSINLPESITNLGRWTFRGCHELIIENLYLPNLSTIYSDSFYGYGTDQGSFPYIKNITSLGKITTLPAGNPAAGMGTFASFTGLQSINLHEGITNIGACAFYNCTSLPNITLPSTITNIGRWSFRYCSALAYIICLSTVPPTLYDGQVFQYCSSLTSIYVPYSEDHSILNAYQTATNWSTYASKIKELNQDGTIPTT